MKAFFKTLCILIISSVVVGSSIASAQIDVTLIAREHGRFHISCNGGSDGSIDAIITGENPPFSFQWTSTTGFTSYQKSISGLSAGDYTLTVTDNNNNTVQKIISLEEPEPLIIYTDKSVYEGGYNIRCQGCQDGYIKTGVKGGTPNYSYLWSTGSDREVIEGIGAGTYTVTITDVNGCTASNSSSLSEPTPLHFVSVTSPQHNSFNVSCSEGRDGVIDVTVAGGSGQYIFNCDGIEKEGTGNTMHFAELEAREHTIYVRDRNDIKINTTIILTQPDRLRAELIPSVYPPQNKNLSCYNCANGVLTPDVTGGAAPYTYAWSNGQSTSTISNLPEHDYSVVITDANGCRFETGRGIIAPAKDGWSMDGNSGVTSTQFMGTTDNADFVLKANSQEMIRLSKTTTSESVTLHSLAGTGISLISADNTGKISRSNFLNYTPGTSSTPSVFRIADGTNPPIVLPNMCNMPQNYPSNYQFTGMLQSIGNSHTGGQVNVLSMGFDGQNGIIDIQGVNSGPIQPRLLLNYYCGRDVIVGNGSSGNLYANQNFFTNGSATIGSSNAAMEKVDVYGNGRFSNSSNHNLFTTIGHDGVHGAINCSDDLYINYYTGKNVLIGGQGGASNLTVLGKIDINNVGSTNAIALNVNGGAQFIESNPNYSFQIVSGTPSGRGISVGSPQDGNVDFYLDNYQNGGFTFVANHPQLGGRRQLMRINGDGGVHIGKDLIVPGNFMLAVDGDVKLLDTWNGNNNTLQILSGSQIPTRRGITIDDEAHSGDFNFFIHDWQTNSSFNFLDNDASNNKIINLLKIRKDGKVGIGISDNSNWDGSYKLYVAGGIRTEKVKVDVAQTAGWADYVFESGYKLKSPEQIEKFISENGHLPGIPTLVEVKENGIDLAEMQTKLLEKVEELTLYIIDLKKENTELKGKVESILKNK